MPCGTDSSRQIPDDCGCIATLRPDHDAVGPLIRAKGPDMFRPRCATPRTTSRCRPGVEFLEGRALPSAAPLLQDTFGDNFFDTTKWVSGRTDAAGNPIAVRERNQRLEFTGPGSVASRAEFVPSEEAPLEITGVWYWAPTPGMVGNAQLITRATGIYVTEDGVEFRAEPGVGVSIRLWQDRQATVLASVVAKIDVGDLFRFRVRDDGHDVSISLTEIDGDRIAVSLAAQTDAASETNHVAFRYGNVAFAPVARLALDDVVVSVSPPEPDPEPGPLPNPLPAPRPNPPGVPAPPLGRPIIIPAVPLEFWVDETPDGDGPAPRNDMSRQIKVQRGKLRRGRRGKLRQLITLLNTTAGDVTELKLAFARLAKNARVRVAGGDWVTAAQAARGVGLGDRDVLRPGESVTVEIEINHADRPQFMTRVLGNLEPAEE